MQVQYYSGNVVSQMHELTIRLLGLVGEGTLLMMIAIGVYYMTAQGDPAKQQRAKNAFSYALMGLLIILFSYAILATLNRLATTG